MDTHPSARIVAICGVDDMFNANANLPDGWFLSDFFFFNILMKDLGSSQLWPSALHPQDLVDEYSEYLHGNSYDARKIVLDQQIINENQEIF